MTHLSEPEALKCLTYMERCLKQLGAPQWRATLSNDPVSEADDADAMTRVTKLRHIATVWLNKDWESNPNHYTEQLKREVLFHECVHIANGTVDEFIDRLQDQSALSKDVFDLLADQYHMLMERFVDALVRGTSEADHLPAWPTATDIKGAKRRQGGL